MKAKITRCAMLFLLCHPSSTSSTPPSTSLYMYLLHPSLSLLYFLYLTTYIVVIITIKTHLCLCFLTMNVIWCDNDCSVTSYSHNLNNGKIKFKWSVVLPLPLHYKDRLRRTYCCTPSPNRSLLSLTYGSEVLKGKCE